MKAGLSSEEFRKAGHEVVDWIADYLRDVHTMPVTPEVRPGEVLARLPRQAPEEGEPMEAILRDFREVIVPGLVHWNHPKFLAYFSISASGPGILGEMLAAGLNVNQLLWKTAPAASELEQVTLSWLRQWVGLPEEFFGIIHDTASTATLHAVLAAREYGFPKARFQGAPAGMTLYCSELAHSSVDKAALAAGVGLDDVRHVKPDGEFRMRGAALEQMIVEDRARGKKPFCVVATVGTTSAASVDAVPEIAEVAARHGLWLHVDGAYAGTAAILEEYRPILEGVEQADSFVMNPHKWLFTPVDLSAFYTRRPEVMRRAVSLTEAPPYLRGEEGVNLSDYSLALGRRFRSLKLWFVLRNFGRKGVEEVLRRHMRAAESVARAVEADGRFEIAAPQRFSLVCFRYRGGGEADGDFNDENRALLEAVNGTHQVLLSSTVMDGRVVLRLAIGNLQTTEGDALAAWELVRAAADQLAR